MLAAILKSQEGEAEPEVVLVTYGDVILERPRPVLTQLEQRVFLNGRLVTKGIWTPYLASLSASSQPVIYRTESLWTLSKEFLVRGRPVTQTYRLVMLFKMFLEMEEGLNDEK